MDPGEGGARAQKKMERKRKRADTKQQQEKKSTPHHQLLHTHRTRAAAPCQCALMASYLVAHVFRHSTAASSISFFSYSDQQQRRNSSADTQKKTTTMKKKAMMSVALPSTQLVHACACKTVAVLQPRTQPNSWLLLLSRPLLRQIGQTLVPEKSSKLRRHTCVTHCTYTQRASNEQ